LDELGEVPNQLAIEDFLNNQRAPSRNYIPKELPSPSFPTKRIVDLQFNVLITIRSIQ